MAMVYGYDATDFNWIRPEILSESSFASPLMSTRFYHVTRIADI